MRRILFALFLAAAPAQADAPKPDALKPDAPTTAAPPMQRYGADHPDCLGWTDGCAICTPKTCSTPGIACTPHEAVCTVKAAAPEPPKPDASKPDGSKPEAPKPEAPKPAEPAPVAPPAQKP